MIREKLEKIVCLERYIYTLQKVVDSENTIKREINEKNIKPTAPIEPNCVVKKIPQYDERVYRKKAKEKGSALGGFREACFNAMAYLAGSVIGLVVCWIPLFLWLFSFPFSIGHTQRMAHKIYLEECEKIDNQNQHADWLVKDYLQEKNKYEMDLKEYERQCFLYPKKIALLDSQTRRMKDTIVKLKMCLSKCYKESELPEPYQNFVSSHMLLSYLNKNVLINDAKKTLQSAIRNGEVCTDIMQAQRYKDNLSTDMEVVFISLRNCNEDTEKMVYQLKEVIKKYDGSGDREISHIALYINDCTKFCN